MLLVEFCVFLVAMFGAFITIFIVDIVNLNKRWNEIMGKDKQDNDKRDY